MAKTRYPDPPRTENLDLQRAWGELVRELDSRDAKFYAPGDAKWIVVNVSTTTSINVSAASDTYTANILASLIQKLAAKGII